MAEGHMRHDHTPEGHGLHQDTQPTVLWRRTPDGVIEFGPEFKAALHDALRPVVQDAIRDELARQMNTALAAVVRGAHSAHHS